MNRFLLAAFAVAAVAGSGRAHDLKELEFDRTIAVRLDSFGATVVYTLRLTDASAVLDGLKFFRDEVRQGSTDRRKYAERYAPLKAGQIAQSMYAELDGKRVKFQLDGSKSPNVVPRLKDGDLELEFHFRARWDTTVGKQHHFTFNDLTEYVDKANAAVAEDVPGPVTLTIDELKKRGDTDIVEFDEPTKYRGVLLPQIPPGKEPDRRKCSATFTVSGNLGAWLRPNWCGRRGWTPTDAAPGQPNVAPLTDDRPIDGKLDRLLNTNVGLGLALLLAGVFGAGHAFTPGHGKTMVAAYLIGERGTMKHAVVLGLTATLAHTGSVILLAILLYSAYGDTAPASAQAWLMIAGGLFLFVIGFWLFLQRIRGRADHVHLFAGDHTHGPNGEHIPAPPKPTGGGFGWWRVILLGVGGGIIPCWDAVGLFLVAMGDGKIGLAIPLLLAFSVGLCAVLILLGVAVVYANRKGAIAFQEKRWFKALPVVSAVVLVALGGWFLSDGFQLLMGTG